MKKIISLRPDKEESPDNNMDNPILLFAKSCMSRVEVEEDKFEDPKVEKDDTKEDPHLRKDQKWLLKFWKNKPRFHQNPKEFEQLHSKIFEQYQLSSLFTGTALSVLISGLRHNQSNMFKPSTILKFNLLSLSLLIKYFEEDTELRQNTSFISSLKLSFLWLHFENIGDKQTLSHLFDIFKRERNAFLVKTASKGYHMVGICVINGMRLQRFVINKARRKGHYGGSSVPASNTWDSIKFISSFPVASTLKTLPLTRQKQVVGNCAIIALLNAIEFALVMDPIFLREVMFSSPRYPQILKKEFKRRYKIKDHRVRELLIKLIIESGANHLTSSEIDKLKDQARSKGEQQTFLTVKKLVRKKKSLFDYLEFPRLYTKHPAEVVDIIVRKIEDVDMDEWFKKEYRAQICIDFLAYRSLSPDKKATILAGLLPIPDFSFGAVRAVCKMAGASNDNRKILGENRNLINPLNRLIRSESGSVKRGAERAVRLIGSRSYKDKKR